MQPRPTYLLVPRLHRLAEPVHVRQLPELPVHLGEGSSKPLLLREVQLLLQGKETQLLTAVGPRSAKPRQMGSPATQSTQKYSDRTTQGSKSCNSPPGPAQANQATHRQVAAHVLSTGYSNARRLLRQQLWHSGSARYLQGTNMTLDKVSSKALCVLIPRSWDRRQRSTQEGRGHQGRCTTLGRGP